ncbi:MAG: 3-deoxy-manno-octulosonate cytidylyltransferase [Chloroflexi bacterium]|nr:3-deoxy-manno-octulosonate cytidylyltransferase [Chloroflexota bacterium]
MADRSQKSAIFVTARTKSTRLERKALIEIQGKPVIEHLIDRLKLARLPGLIVLCTSTHPDDAVLADIAVKNGIEAFRGSEDDVLRRLLDAATKYDVHYVINVGGDNIFYGPGLIDRTLKTLIIGGTDLVRWKDLPLGTACRGIRVAALRKVCDIKLESDTEVFEPYFTDTGLFRVKTLEPHNPMLRRPGFRLTLDYAEDLRLFQGIFAALYVPGSVFRLKDVVAFLDSHPWLLEINRGVHADYWKSIEDKIRKARWKLIEQGLGESYCPWPGAPETGA